MIVNTGKKIVLAILIFLSLENAFLNAQTGAPYILNFSTREYRAHGQNFDIAIDKQGMLYVANFAGILQYDGISWRIIPSSNITKISSLCADSTGRIYAGARGEFGYLKSDPLGNLDFFNLSADLTDSNQVFSDIVSIEIINENVFFLSDKKIFTYHHDTLSIYSLSDPLIKGFTANHRLFLLLKTRGLVEFTRAGIIPVPGGDRFSETVPVAFMTAINDKKILIGTSNQGFFTLQGQSITPWQIESSAIIKDNILLCGTRLENGDIAIGTIRNGVIFLAPDGHILQTVNKSVGLADDNVNYIFAGKNNEIWLALNNGLALMEYPSPFMYFNDRGGINGGVQQIIGYNQTIYCATYKGVSYYDPEQAIFKELQDIKTTCWVLLNINQKLWAATSQGVFLIENQKVTPMTKSFSLNLHYSPLTPNYLYISQLDGFYRWQFEGATLINPKRIGPADIEFREQIEDKSGRLWLISPSHGLYRVNLKDPSMKMTRIDTSNGLPDLIGNHIHSLASGIWITAKTGIFHWNEKENHFIKDDFLELDSLNHELWLYRMVEDPQGNIWTTLGDETNITMYKKQKDGEYEKFQTPFLPHREFVVWSIWRHLRGQVWFGGPDGILVYNPTIEFPYSKPFYVLIRRVMIRHDSSLFEGNQTPDENQPLTLSYSDNTILFEYSATSYDVKGELLFQYYLEGFDKVWSNWTNTSAKEYTNLPPGKYGFRVKSKNIYQTEFESVKFEFTITPPWYRTWWAYFLYIILAGLTIAGLIRLRSIKLMKEKKELENIIHDRTAEVVQQKEELEKQSSELASKNSELEKINLIVKSINAEINFTNLLNTILEKMKVVKAVDNATALVIDKGSDYYRYKSSLLYDMNQIEDIQLTLEETEARYLKNCEEVYEDIFINRDFSTATSEPLVDGYENSSSIVVIVAKIEKKVEGFLILENLSRKDAFSLRDLSLLKNLKEHIIAAFIKTKILEDLQATFNNLKATQQQLVQSEKLASLGQLTAGIAHEIQNPLNFVNNFSGPSIDLANELLEYVEKFKTLLQEDDYDEILDLAEMIKDNLTRIKDHGKRAEGIVKGMLMHARGKTSEFQMYEINNMVSEYATLAYHGTRANNKDFTVSLKFDLDPNVGKIRIVPQDFSRVILNIVNNACYAINEKKQNLTDSGNEFSPEITLSTHKIEHFVEIRIRDNGTGMPPSVREKIFQPFYTTKPTGKGTGLGLSMSYDIVTQLHKGKMEVSSAEGEWTEFILTIPEEI